MANETPDKEPSETLAAKMAWAQETRAEALPPEVQLDSALAERAKVQAAKEQAQRPCRALVQFKEIFREDRPSVVLVG